LPMATYVIVLTAMRLSNVSYVVPLRETSIIFATLLGVLVLGERIGAARIAGSALIATGVIAIALGG
ncbi:MAG TPA: EamA family transporter, partial [Thermomicrobiales bacterium]|nr:EamA family transporter [Thermomicrobiales bacterium]